MPKGDRVLQALQAEDMSALRSNAFDINGFYVAVTRNADGSVQLSELMNNRLKERETFLIGDHEGIEEFLNRVGLARVVFIDWHGEWVNEADIRIHELVINWEDENPMSGLGDSFSECANLLSCPPSGNEL